MFITPDECERRWGATTYLQLTDRDGDGEPDDGVIEEICTDANREVEGRIVKKGFSHEQLQVLAKDETLRRCAANIAREIGAEQKPMFVRPDGTTIFTPAAERARKTLEAVATSAIRLPLERAVGAGPTEQVKSPRQEAIPPFFIAASKNRPRGAGGF